MEPEAIMNQKIGAILAVERLLQRRSQADVVRGAHRVIDQSTLSLYEQGKVRHMHLHVLACLAKSLHRPLTVLLEPYLHDEESPE